MYLEPVWSGKQALKPIGRENAEGEMEKIAEGYEEIVSLNVVVDEKRITWNERRLIVRSLKYALSSEEGLRTRLAKAQAELIELNVSKQGKKQIKDRASMQTAAEKILKHYRVVNLVKLEITEQSEERHIRAYDGRPARIEEECTLTLHVEINDQAVQEAVRWLGWRVYATNQPEEVLPLEKAVLVYREEYLVERGFGRLKGKPLSVSPMYLQSDERATGLIRLLSIGLRILTLIEYQVRQRLADLKEKLPGMYAGNPKRTTDRPTAEAMLRSFKGIYLSVVILGEQVFYHVTPLSVVQVKILSLLDFSSDIYTQLVSNFPKPAGKMTEP
jgi:transposase